MDRNNAEQWILDVTEEAFSKKAQKGKASLTAMELLLYEVGLFDMEQQNGGVSQYFCNRGLEQWKKLCELAVPLLPSFAVFAMLVDDAIRGWEDPYLALVDESAYDPGEDSSRLDSLYYDNYQIPILSELKAYVEANR